MAEMKGEPVAALDPYSLAMEAAYRLSQGNKAEFEEARSTLKGTPYAAVLDDVHEKIAIHGKNWHAHWTDQDGFKLNAAIGTVYRAQNTLPAAPEENPSTDSDASPENGKVELPEMLKVYYEALQPCFDGDKSSCPSFSSDAQNLAEVLNLSAMSGYSEKQYELIEKEVRPKLDAFLRGIGADVKTGDPYDMGDVAMKLQSWTDNPQANNTPAHEYKR